MRSRIGVSLVVVLAFLSLVTNREARIPAVLWGMTAVLAAILAFRSRRRPGALERGALIVWAAWSVSYVLTTEPLVGLLSPGFLRRDGLLFVSLVPLLVLPTIAPAASTWRMALAAFSSVQAFLVVLGCAIAALGAQERFAGILFNRYDQDPQHYYIGLYQAHNAAGSVLGVCFLACAALAVFSAPSRRRWGWGLLALPLLWGMMLTKSRGSLLALGLTFAALIVLALRRRAVSRKAMVVGLGVLALSAAVFSPLLIRRFGQFAGHGTHSGRWEWWKRGMTEWTWSPLAGTGMGRYNDLDREWSGVKHLYYVATKARVVNDAGHAHNSYVHFLAEGGVIGFGITVGFWAWVGWRLRRSREPLRIAAFLGIVFLFAISMTEHYMGGGAMLLVLSSIVGVAWSLPEPPAEGGIPA